MNKIFDGEKDILALSAYLWNENVDIFVSKKNLVCTNFGVWINQEYRGIKHVWF